MVWITEIKNALLHLVFPHICAGCGSDVLNETSALCIRCVHSLPATGFEHHAGNPVEKIFWGRLPLAAATAQYYFTKASLIQHLMHEFKYQRNKDLGLQLGRMMGEQLLNSRRFNVDALVPLPLFASKERKRGYNQATLLCEGMAEQMKIPVLNKAIIRNEHTSTQTKKGRIERWQNMHGKFSMTNPETIRDLHLLLVDDVITTGATLEACGTELLKIENVQLSMAGLCISSR